MKAPMCGVCGEFGEGYYLTFANYKPLPDGLIGHPSGLEFFCNVHLPIAEQFTHLSFHEAIDRIEEFLKQSSDDNQQPQNQNTKITQSS